MKDFIFDLQRFDELNLTKDNTDNNGNTYLITSAADLQTLANYVNNVDEGHNCDGLTFKLTTDIDLSTLGTDAWTPIGTPIGNEIERQFKGTFDGGNHTISGLKITNGVYNVGLFGWVGPGGTVNNVNLTGVKVSGYKWVGGVAGVNNGTVNNCTVSGSVNGTNYVGGVVGQNAGGTVTNCTNSVDIRGNEWIGGVVGYNDHQATVSNCTNNGSVRGNYEVGGIVGQNNDEGSAISGQASNSKVSGCTNSGSVSGYKKVGGIVGENYNRGIVTDGNKNTGSVSGYENVGSVVGINCEDTTVSDNYCYKSSNDTLNDVGNGNTGNSTQLYKLTLPENATNVRGVSGTVVIKDNFVYATKNATVTFTYNEGTLQNDGNLTAGGDNSYTYTMPETNVIVIDSSLLKNFATDGTTYLIETAEQLQIFATYVNNGGNTSGKTFKLVNDVEMSDLEHWTPIGDATHAFNGTFDGNGKIIKNLNGCLFGNGSITNATITNCYYHKAPGDTTTGTDGGTQLYKIRLPADATYQSGGVVIDGNDVYAENSAQVKFNYSGDYYLQVGDNALVKVTDGNYTYKMTAQDATITPKHFFYETLERVGYNTWLIKTAADLQNLATEVNATSETMNNVIYKLANDIDLSTLGENYNFTPIGTGSNPFQATFDGGKYDENGKLVGNYTISGLTITDSENNKVGLFGYVKGKVQNVNLTGVNISGKVTATEYILTIGGVAGVNEGTVTNCTVDGTISGEVTATDAGASVGGVVGYNYNGGTVENCAVSGSVTATGYGAFVGGVVGSTRNGTVSGNISVSSVTATEDINTIGGVVGKNDLNSTVSGNYYYKSSDTLKDVGGAGSGTNNTALYKLTLPAGAEVTSGAKYTETAADGKVSVYAASGATVKFTYSGGDTLGNKFTSVGTNTYTYTMTEQYTGGTGDTGGGTGDPPPSTGGSGGRPNTGGILNPPGSSGGSSSGNSGTSGGEQTGTGGGEQTGTDSNYDIVVNGVTIKADPVTGIYSISKPEQLQALATYVNGIWDNNADKYVDANDCADLTFKVTANIDLSSVTNFTPIGTGFNPFRGTFDGGSNEGKTISGLTITDNDLYAGLFGCVDSGGIVKNVKLEDVDITGKNQVGGVVGSNSGTVTGCTVTGDNSTISGDEGVGGVVGHNEGEVKDSKNLGGAVSGSSSVGGVVGCNNGGKVSGSTNSGSVSGTGDNVGGVVGLNKDSGEVSGSTNSGEVSGNENVGGVVGQNYSGGTVGGTTDNEKCTNSGEVSGRKEVGGVVGHNEGDTVSDKNTTTGTVSLLYKLTLPDGATEVKVDGKEPTFTETDDDDDITAVYAPAGAKVTFEYSGNLKSDENLSKDEDDTFTYTMTAEDAEIETATFLDTLDGEGTADDPYLIKTATNLQDLATYVNAGNTCDGLTFKVIDNINLSTLGENYSWTPIGNDSNHPFLGTFDGGSSDNKTISNLKITNGGNSVGLFGKVGKYFEDSKVSKGATIQNVNLTGVEISGTSKVGGVVGSSYSSIITNCTVNGNSKISGTGDFVGGVVGYNNYTTVSGCTVRGSVSGRNYVGGIVGENFEDDSSISGNTNEASVIGNTNYASVSGSQYGIGGIVGKNKSNATISNNTNSGSVSGKKDIGGVIGFNNSKQGTVDGNINSGTVTAKNDGDAYVGGIIGNNKDSNATISNNSNSGNVSGTGEESSAIGGIVGFNNENSKATISNNSNSGTISGKKNVGGIVGVNKDNSGTVQNCTVKDTNGATLYKLTLPAGATGVTVNNADPTYTDKDANGKITAVYAAEKAQVTFTCAGDYLKIGTEFYKVQDGTYTYEMPAADTTVESATFFDTLTKDTDGSYLIKTVEDLQRLADYVNSGTEEKPHTCEGKTFKVDATIDLSSIGNWTPIGNDSNHPFLGTFDGGCVYDADGTITKTVTISGLKITGTSNNVGLFGFVEGVKDENNGTVTGGIVKNVNLTVNNISGTSEVGGVVGRNEGGKISGCTVNVSDTISGNQYVGGVVGKNSGTVENCAVSGNGSITGTGDTPDNIGGVVGENSNSGTISDSTNGVKVSGHSQVGGVVGTNNSGTVTGNTNSGAVSSTGENASNVGGVVGINQGTASGNTNSGSVTGSTYVGGVVGSNFDTVGGSTNTGTINGNSEVGGVVGSNNNGTVGGTEDKDKCENRGSVSGDSEVGGVVGHNFKGTVSGTTNSGTISGISYVGGVVGSTVKGTVGGNTNSGSVIAYINFGGVFGSNNGTVSGNTDTGTTTQLYKLTLPTGATEVKVDGKDPTYTETDDNDNITDVYAAAGAKVSFKSDGTLKIGDATLSPNTGTTNEYTYTMTDKDAKIEPATFLDTLNREKDSDGNITCYLIQTAEDLQGLADYVNGGEDCEGKTFKLTADITISGEWTPIGTSENPFKGTFNGGGNAIENLNGCLFGGTGGKVQNVTLINVNVDGSENVALFGNGKVENCYYYEKDGANFTSTNGTQIYKVTLPAGAENVTGGVYTDGNDVYATTDAQVKFTYNGNLQNNDALTKNDDGSYSLTVTTEDTEIEIVTPSPAPSPSPSPAPSPEPTPVTPNTPDNVNFNGNTDPEKATSAKLTADFSGTFDANEYSNLKKIEVDADCQNDITIVGNNNGNRITTGAGNDNVGGGTGKDYIDGGRGNDKLSGGVGSDEVHGGEGNDEIHGGNGGSDVSDGDIGNADEDLIEDNDKLYGDAGNDLIYGDEGDDYISGGDDDDTLDGGADNDKLYGDAGNDELSGDDGNDYLYGGDGDDILNGGADNDKLSGDAGNDELHGGDGKDELRGGDGDDILNGDEGNDKLYGGEGNDELNGGEGSDRINGDDGNDLVDGDEGNDYLSGNDGDDTLSGGIGSDYLHGGNGNDSLDGGDDKDYLYGGAGDDSLSGGNGDDYLYGDVGEDLIYGDAGNDSLHGSKGNDILYGGDGDDKIYGEADNDSLFGEDGNDLLKGGTGNDTLDGGNGNDKLFGEEDDDLLNGGDGDDTLKGGSGNDSLHGDGGNDSLIGGSGEDYLFGDDGSDTLNGGSENDILDGGAGDDFLCGEAGDDEIFGFDGNDYLKGGSGNDSLHGGDGDDIIFGGKGDDSLWGDDGANTFIYGVGDGNDVIFGFGDDDTLTVNGFAEAAILPVYDSETNSVTIKLSTGSVTFKEFTATEFNIGDSTWQLSDSKLTKK